MLIVPEEGKAARDLKPEVVPILVGQRASQSARKKPPGERRGYVRGKACRAARSPCHVLCWDARSAEGVLSNGPEHRGVRPVVRDANRTVDAGLDIPCPPR